MGLKRDVASDSLSAKEKTWYIIKHGRLPRIRIEKRAMDDGPPGERCYLEYILTDKENYKDINWETSDET